MKSVYPWTDRLDKSRKRNVISPRGDSKHFSAKRVQLFFNGVLKATSIYLRVLGRSRRLPWWQAQFISASVETPFTRSRRLFHLLNLTLTSAHPWLGSPAEPCSLPPLEPPETSKTLSSGLNRAVRDREPKKFKKKRKRRNLGSSNILKIFKLNIPFHRAWRYHICINTDSIYEGRVSPTNLSPRSWIRTVYTMNPQTRVIVYANSSVNSGRRPDCRIGKR